MADKNILVKEFIRLLFRIKVSMRMSVHGCLRES